MTYKFTFKHLEPLQSITDYAQTRFEKLEKFKMHKEMKVHFIFSVQREDQTAEVLLDSGSHHYAATATDPLLYAAIDKVVDKVEKQLKKFKEKIQNHHAESLAEGHLRKELADPSGGNPTGISKAVPAGMAPVATPWTVVPSVTGQPSSSSKKLHSAR